jgi:hypothetical protein
MAGKDVSDVITDLTELEIGGVLSAFFPKPASDNLCDEAGNFCTV